MNKLLTLLVGWFFAFGLSAQNDGHPVYAGTDSTKVPNADSAAVRISGSYGYTPEFISAPTLDFEVSPSLFMPGTLSGDWTGWRLHEGFNAQLAMSLTTGIGKHAPRGVGFSQNAAFAYLIPVSKKFTIAAGISAEHRDWGSYNRTDIGIGAIAAYTVNERLTLYAYGQKTFLPHRPWTYYSTFSPVHTPVVNGMPLRPAYPFTMDVPRDRLGVAAEYKLGKNAVIGVSVERTTY